MTCAQKRKQKNNLRRRLTSLGLMLTLGLLFNSPAEAQALDGTAVKDLALQGTWAAQDGYGYWSWKEDNSVCIRLFEKDAKCADTGTWTINDNVICYEYTWWGKSNGVGTNCITVHALGDDRYETLHHGGAMVSTFFKFKVLNGRSAG